MEGDGYSICHVTQQTSLCYCSTQLEFDSSSVSENYAQLKMQTLELWCLQRKKLGNLISSAGDKHQITRPDHQLGIDAFVAEAMRLSPNLTPTQALKLLILKPRNWPMRAYVRQS